MLTSNHTNDNKGLQQMRIKHQQNNQNKTDSIQTTSRKHHKTANDEREEAKHTVSAPLIPKFIDNILRHQTILVFISIHSQLSQRYAGEQRDISPGTPVDGRTTSRRRWSNEASMLCGIYVFKSTGFLTVDL